MLPLGHPSQLQNPYKLRGVTGVLSKALGLVSEWLFPFNIQAGVLISVVALASSPPSKDTLWGVPRPTQ